jgi:DsbC/DsbD-like thiol-disulfide interchange protein
MRLALAPAIATLPGMTSVPKRLPHAALALGLLCTPAAAASSDWAEVEGGSVRIVTEGLPDDTGMLRGALEIALKPGWKTYWRDPGESGIPPIVTVLSPEGESEAEIGFPAPARFNEGFSVWAGYDRPVALALTLTLPGDSAGNLAASVFLGICEVICIPVQAELDVDLTDTSQAVLDRNVVEAAFAALPQAAGPGFNAALRKAGKSNIVVDAEVPSGAGEAELFLVSTEDWAFGTPKRIEGPSGPAFDIPILMAPETRAAASAIEYTLVAGENAVSGTFEITR